ncbi:MAG: glutamate synthase-related protein, partial [Armatimonadota bacterium]
MPHSVPNASAATQTHLRTARNYSRLSGMCATCLDGCPGFCEVGTSAFRGAEAIYPQPFGNITAGAEKEYPVDYGSFNINGTAVGAVGIAADSDIAIFPSVDLTVSLGHDGGIKLGLPFSIPGLGSTDIAAKNWNGLAAGAALTGTLLTIGENVCGMDDEAEFSKDAVPQVIQSPELRHRIRSYRDWQHEGMGGIVLQENVEDSRLGIMRYGLSELGADIAELKWGQGAKNIGGEVKLNTLARAQRLKRRGYIVLPDPDDAGVQQAYERGAIKEFERHSRVGMVTEEGFMSRVAELRALGAKYVFLKTGAYRPADLARAIKYSSLAKIDVLTIDAAGGGTGMSPWRMMNEWGLPPIEMITLARKYMD